MKQESSQKMLGLALEVFLRLEVLEENAKSSKNSAPSSYHTTSEKEKLIQLILQAQNSDSAEATDLEQPDDSDIQNESQPIDSSSEWVQLLLAVCQEKYANRSSGMNKKSISETIDNITKLYIEGKKKYDEQFIGAVGCTFQGLVVGPVTVLLMGGAPSIALWAFDPNLHSIVAPYAYFFIACIALSVLVGILSIFVYPDKHSIFKEDIEPHLFWKKEIEMQDFAPVPTCGSV